MIENQLPVNTELTKSSTSESMTQHLTDLQVHLIEFRCPQCFKLYETDASDIHSGKPQFECQACCAVFSFDYPATNPKIIHTKALLLPQVAKMSQKHKSLNSEQPEFTTCRKCSTSNPRKATECYKCGVILAKAQAPTSGIEKSMAGLPSLMKMWQELMSDYTNMTKHMAFVDRCEDLQALPFALKKYKQLKEVQPQDSLAQQMLNSVLLKTLSRKTSQVVSLPGVKILKEIPWKNLFRSSPLFLCGFMILMGLTRYGSPNLTGGGVALLVLILGIVYFLKGRIDWRYFWKP